MTFSETSVEIWVLGDIRASCQFWELFFHSATTLLSNDCEKACDWLPNKSQTSHSIKQNWYRKKEKKPKRRKRRRKRDRLTDSTDRSTRIIVPFLPFLLGRTVLVFRALTWRLEKNQELNLTMPPMTTRSHPANKWQSATNFYIPCMKSCVSDSFCGQLALKRSRG